MTIQASTLRPGLLVSLKTSLRGNVTYRTRDIETDHTTADGVRLAKWETERTISDAAEHELAGKARSKARSLVTAVCAQSAFGLLCPETATAELESAIAEARRTVEAFNATARLSRIGLYVIIGRVAADDVEAVRAINSEVRDLLSAMETGVQNLEVKAIRDAANKARSIGQMLQPEAAARIQVAIDAARKAARRIVDVGAQAAQEIDRRTLATLAEARTAFLDLDESGSAVAMPEAESRALDLEPPATVETAPPIQSAAIELDDEVLPSETESFRNKLAAI